MTRQDYLNALRAALHGLPPTAIERTLADYARRFDDGQAAGRSDADIARELDDPLYAAATVRNTIAHGAAHSSTAKAARVFASSLGLLAFNVVMLLPAMIYGLLLFAFGMVAIACYVGGIASTASSLAGINAMSFNLPFEQIVIESEGNAPHRPAATDARERVRVDFGDTAIRVEQGDRAGDARNTVTVRQEKRTSTVGGQQERRALKVLDGAGIILGGVALMLLWAMVIKYTWIGIKRYGQMHVAILRNA
jgi:uncharacterized membrane protein